MLMASGKHCFVIMPFSTTGDKHTTEYWDSFFSSFIKPAVENLGYTCKRSSAQPGNIMKAVVNELVNSDVVLAVLTDYNPNVLYELGTRHSLKHGTIMMIESGQDIPFDIRQYGVIYYDDKIAGVPKFQENLRDAIQKIESKEPDSPVHDLSSLKEDPDYEEAKLHWEQDLKDIGIDPEVIEAKVKALNKDVDTFFISSQIEELVIAAITADGKLTPFKSYGVPPLNHISINYLINQLLRDWIEDLGVDRISYETDTHHYNLRSLDDMTIIATIELNDKTRLDNIINNLRSKDNSISHHIQAFKERRVAIRNDVMKLNNEMNKRIINRISKKVYKTTCSNCDDNVLAGG